MKKLHRTIPVYETVDVETDIDIEEYIDEIPRVTFP